jgi:hypothetical protein
MAEWSEFVKAYASYNNLIITEDDEKLLRSILGMHHCQLWKHT